MPHATTKNASSEDGVCLASSVACMLACLPPPPPPPSLAWLCPVSAAAAAAIAVRTLSAQPLTAVVTTDFSFHTAKEAQPHGSRP